MDQSDSSRDRWATTVLVLLILGGLALLALGVWRAWVAREYVLLGLGLLSVSVPASAHLLVTRRRGADLAEQLGAQSDLLKSINDRLLISDQAKRIAYRQKDREALRTAIEEDLRAEDYDAAMALINEMSETFGYREEAEQFRQRVVDAQTRRREERVRSSIQRIDEICERHDWALARQEAARLKRLYPDHPEVQQLPRRIEQAREKHKSELEREFLQAAERDDVERAMELMTELDKYLTPEEAQPYMETARGIVGKKRQNLGVRFKMAIQDRDWIDALNVGEQIIREFPNTQMAREVRGTLDTLRERAAGQRAAMSEQQQEEQRTGA